MFAAEVIVRTIDREPPRGRRIRLYQAASGILHHSSDDDSDDDDSDSSSEGREGGSYVSAYCWEAELIEPMVFLPEWAAWRRGMEVKSDGMFAAELKGRMIL